MYVLLIIHVRALFNPVGILIGKEAHAKKFLWPIRLRREIFNAWCFYEGCVIFIHCAWGGGRSGWCGLVSRSDIDGVFPHTSRRHALVYIALLVIWLGGRGHFRIQSAALCGAWFPLRYLSVEVKRAQTYKYHGNAFAWLQIFLPWWYVSISPVQVVPISGNTKLEKNHIPPLFPPSSPHWSPEIELLMKRKSGFSFGAPDSFHMRYITLVYFR